MQDVIQREIIISASKEHIFSAIADPKQVILWFPETLEGEYRVGEHATLGFGDHGKCSVYIVNAKPYEYFSYRWVPGANQFVGDVLSVPNTLVEFRIEELADNACKVTLTESGFSTLPREFMQDSLKQNSSGWDFMLKRLTKYFDVL